MSHQISIGFVDYTKLVFIPDPASTDGSGKTGLVAANLTVSYTRVETDNDVTVTDVTSSLNNLAALTTAHTDWGVLEVSSTLAPGLYRLDIADAVFAAGAWTAVVYVMITTSAAAPSPVEFELVAFNKLDGVRLGLTALPNAAADAAGGLPISDAGGLDLDARLDAAITSRMATYTQPTGFLAATFPADPADASDIAAAFGTVNGTLATIGGNVSSALAAVDTEVGAIKTKTDQLTFSTANRIDAQVFGMEAATVTAGAIATDAIDADALKADAVTEIQSGLATASALAVVDGIVDDILLDTAEIGTAGDGLTNINLPNQTMDIVGNITGNLSGSVGSVTSLTASDVGAIKTVTDKLSPTASAIGRGTVNTGSSTTSVTTSAFSPAGAVADQFKGRVILFDATTTTPTLRGTASTITASSNAATPTFTVDTLPATPQSGDTFSIV